MAALTEIEKSINQRVKLLYKELKERNIIGNVTEFCEKGGLDRSNFSKYFREDEHQKEVKTEVVVKLTQNFNVNPNWLLTGEEPMLKEVNKNSTSEVQVVTHDEDPPVYRLSRGKKKFSPPKIEIHSTTVDKATGRENIYMVETEAKAGYIQHYIEPEFIKELPALSLPGADFHNATFRCFQISGDSMAPGIQNGDFVIASLVPDWPNNIKDGYVHIVVTKGDVVAKRLLNRLYERGKVVIQSDNETWPVDEIDGDDILEVWLAKAKVSFKFPNLRYDTAKKIASLEADVFAMKQFMQDIQNKLK